MEVISAKSLASGVLLALLVCAIVVPTVYTIGYNQGAWEHRTLACEPMPKVRVHQ